MKYCLSLIFLLSLNAFPQYDKKFSIGINFIYTTDARIFLHPNAADPFERTTEFDLSGINSPGINFRYKLLEELYLDLDLEYLKKTGTGLNEQAYINGILSDINVEDGFRMIPVELSIYYLLPFSTDNLKFLMGGGGGYYYGSMIRKFGSLDVSTIKRKIAYGIQVSVDMEYVLLQDFSVRAEMKFRDPQFTVSNHYNKQEFSYEGNMVRIARQDFETKINVYGVNFLFGFVYHF
jgi:hypothetical protein